MHLMPFIGGKPLFRTEKASDIEHCSVFTRVPRYRVSIQKMFYLLIATQ